MKDCLFCKIIKKEVPAEIIYEDKDVIAFLDIAPGNPGHALVVPKNHSKNLLETSKEDALILIEITKMLAPKIIKAVKADGFNIFVNTNKEAGQIIFHTHLHLMPRFKNDGLKYLEGSNIKPRPLKIVKKDIKKVLDN